MSGVSQIQEHKIPDTTHYNDRARRARSDTNCGFNQRSITSGESE
jgi:hypothetical protein